MPNEEISTPRQYQGVMVSSTFMDLQEHRDELMKALQKQELFFIGMENYVVNPRDNIVSSSLDMVRKGSAYIGLISQRYGQIVECAENPHSYSVSRLEFEEAQSLNRPTLVFIMGDEYKIKATEIEIDPDKRKKLEEYRVRAKEGRIYVVFNSLEEFTKEVIHAVARLREYLEEQNVPTAPRVTPTTAATAEANPIPTPPAFYAEPRYIGSHEFVGRSSQLDTLSDWATAADTHPILLFEAIGGTGKSMLTWEWTTKHSSTIRNDWAGCFWYSFYEKGAVMSDFCQRALAYITAQPLEKFRKKKIAELSEQLLFHLQSRPWLFILDGLERVLVAYHRFDAAQIADEKVDTAKDQIAKRDPCSAICPEDDDLLRSLAAAAPSKLLITTRLTPRILLSPSNQGIQGVKRVPLHGLRPADAEQLIRACGITGTSEEIQDYLKRHCDCHPLVTGVLAGLINDYLPNRGNFDAWVNDPEGGGRLNLAELDLVQKRNHILHAALAALPEKSLQLLSTLALLSEAVDFETLSALNPHLTPLPEKVDEPENPADDERWQKLTSARRELHREHYQIAFQSWKEYEQALALSQQQLPTATQELTKTVRDLERRSLLQYDHQSKRYDLHPVVRGVAAGGLKQEDKERFGQRVVDHFSQKTHAPYEEAETLDDVRNGLHIVRALIQMGHYEQASIICAELTMPLLYNLEAYAEILSIQRPFFQRGWSVLPDNVTELNSLSLANIAVVALRNSGEVKEALVCHTSLITKVIQAERWDWLAVVLLNATPILNKMNRIAKEEQYLLLALDVAALLDQPERLFMIRLFRFNQLCRFGKLAEAESIWKILDPMGRNWPRETYRSGEAELGYANLHFYRKTLSEKILNSVEKLAKSGKSRSAVRGLHTLRGVWQLEQGHWKLAVESFQETLRMSREIGQNNLAAEASLSLAKFHLGQLANPREEAERLSQSKEPPHQRLAELWHAIGDWENAKKHALAAYKKAWADGEPYVYRYDLDKARALLEELGAEIPDLPPYDPDKDEKLPWEDDVIAAIENLRAEKEAREKEAEEKEDLP